MKDDYSLHLNANSTATVQTCVTGGAGIDFVIIYGADNFNDWVDSYAETTSGVLYQAYITTPCGTGYTTHTLATTKAGEYYFAWFNSNSYTVSYAGSVNVSRATYDLSGATYQCPLPCTVSLQQGETPHLVLGADPNGNTMADKYVDVTRAPRNSMYFLAFGVPILACVGLTIVCFCSARRRAAAAQASATERAPLTQNDASAAAAAAVQAPQVTTYPPPQAYPPIQQQQQQPYPPAYQQYAPPPYSAQPGPPPPPQVGVANGGFQPYQPPVATASRAMAPAPSAPPPKL